MRISVSRFAVIGLSLLGVGGLAACTATTSNAPGSQAGDGSGVTVFGTVDAGVGRVK